MTLPPDIRSSRRHAIYAYDACYKTIASWIWRNVRPPMAFIPYPEVDGLDWVKVTSPVLG